MNREYMHVLLIEDDAEDALLMQQALEEQAHRVRIHHFRNLKDGLAYLDKSHVDVMVMDVNLPDAKSPESFRKVCQSVAHIPVVVLTSMVGDDLSVDAIRRGAQDYLIKSEFDTRMINRVLRHAIERHQMRRAMEALVLLDDLTTLYNRRGFLTLIEQHIKLAERKEKQFLLLLADMDGLKQINDQHGHSEGDRAIVQAGILLKSTFRESDVVARIGGDEFAVLVIDAGLASVKSILKRLDERIERHNKIAEDPFPLSISTGYAVYNPEEAPALGELIKRADEVLYDCKHGKRRK